jgi:hypothetical protein
MEFYLPSLLVLILAAFMVFFVLPKFAPLALGIIALIALVLGAYQHYTMFKIDYSMMRWQDGAGAAAPYIIVGFIVLYIIGFLLNIYKSKSANLQTSIARNVPGYQMAQPAPANYGQKAPNASNRNKQNPQSLIF